MYNPLLVKQSSIAATEPYDYNTPSAMARRINQFYSRQSDAPQESKPAAPHTQPAGQQPAQQPADPEWSGMYGKDVWRDYQMHKKYMNDPEYKAYTEWYNQNKGRYGTQSQPQPAQQPQQPAGGIQPGQGWQTGPLGGGGQPGGWSPPRNRPNPHYNPMGTGPQQPYITPEGEPASSPFSSPFKSKGRGMGGMFGGFGPNLNWEYIRRNLTM